MNIDPLTEKYNTWSPYAFSGNRVIDSRELEGLEPISIHNNTRNLVIAVQGYAGSEPKYGSTQTQNAVKYAKNAGTDEGGLGKVLRFNDMLRRSQAGVFASGQGEATKKDVLSTIRDFKNKNENGNVILIGHSLGADNLVEMLNENKDIKVNLLITVDIADDGNDTNIPSNVENVNNFYNKNAGLLSLGGNKVKIDNPSVTNGTNIPLDTTHTDIDNDYSELFMDIIDKYIGF